MKYKVLFTAPYMIPFVDRFKPVFDKYDIDLIVPEVHERMEEADLLTYAGQFDGAICGDDRYSARVLTACLPRLKVISKWGTGIDSIDAEACSRYGIKLCRTPNAFTLPVADTVLGYILAFARRQPWMDKEMKSGKWEKISGRALSECTLGIIGVGNIGKAVTRRARAFGMQILGTDIVEIDHVFVAETGIEMTDLESLLRARFRLRQPAELDQPSSINSDTLADETQRGPDQHGARANRRRGGADRSAAGPSSRGSRAGRLRSGAAAGGESADENGQRHAGSAQFQFQPGCLGKGPLEYHPEPAGGVEHFHNGSGGWIGCLRNFRSIQFCSRSFRSSRGGV
jgi:hypothetical protein